MYTHHAAGIVGYDQIGINVVILQVRIALSPVSWLHLVVIAEALQCLLGDVDTP